MWSGRAKIALGRSSGRRMIQSRPTPVSSPLLASKPFSLSFRPLSSVFAVSTPFVGGIRYYSNNNRKEDNEVEEKELKDKEDESKELKDDAEGKVEEVEKVEIIEEVEEIPPTPPNSPEYRGEFNEEDMIKERERMVEAMEDADEVEDVGEGRTGKTSRKGKGAQIISSSFYAPMTGFKVPTSVPVFPFARRPIFPGVLTPLVIHDRSLAQKLLARKEKGHHFIGVFLAKTPPEPHVGDKSSPTSPYQVLNDPSLVHSFGVLARVERILFSNPATGGATVMLTGVMRIKLVDQEAKPETIENKDTKEEDKETKEDEDLHELAITKVHDRPYDRGDDNLRALTAEVVSTIKEIVKLNAFFKEQLQTVLDYIDLSNPSELADLSACLTTSDAASLQDVLEETDVIERLNKSLTLLKKELEISHLQMKIQKQLENQMQINQRKYLLNEQLKAIKKELGIETDEKEALVVKFTKRLEGLKLTETVQKAIDEEILKLSSLDPSSSEFNITRTYLDWITSLPWGVNPPDSLDVPHAKTVLDEDHYGLRDIKERILEFIAVGKLKGSLTGKILCFVGPPGVGKTSIGKSIGRALGREFFRFSVGGMQDVAEIKGHRRTYVGAMPGKILQSLKRVGTSNPVILLDEVDKIGKGGYQGDPASALLEVLDPSQNKEFLDHYLDLPYDLSKVLFICTANVTDTIPGPLLDRMEVLRLSGYVNQEKMSISKQYLIPAARLDSGVTSPDQGVMTESCLNELVQHYCRESGVRNLQKHIEKIFRKMAYKITQGESNKIIVNARNLPEYIGKRVFPKDKMYEVTPSGVVTGLAWTSMGGATLYIETAVSPSLSTNESAHLNTTGQMGDVMKESTKIAYSYAKQFLISLSHLPEYEPHAKFFETKSLHMHIPEGATPKDGPSAGITMVTSLISLAINKPVRQDLAMTGELSLTGLVLPIGGVKEKVLAAKRSNVKYIIFPKANLYDWEDLEGYLKEDLTAFFVEHYRDVFTIAFGADEEMNAMIPLNKTPIEIHLPEVDPEL